MHPPLAHPVRHQPRNRQGRRDRRALEILRFASRVFWDVGDGDVEACQASKAAEDEEGEDEVVEGGAEADCEGGGGGGDAEGYLFRVASAWYSTIHPFAHFSPPGTGYGVRGKTYQISQRIQLLPHQTTLPPPPRDLPIKEVEKQPQRHQRQRSPQIPQLAGGTGHIPHRGEDGHDAAQAVELGD